MSRSSRTACTRAKGDRLEDAEPARPVGHPGAGGRHGVQRPGDDATRRRRVERHVTRRGRRRDAFGRLRRGPTLRALAACSSGAHTLSHFGDRRLSRPGQRRLHERPHRRLPLLRRDDEPVPAGDARRPDRPGDAVPHRLQPRLRADERQHRRAEHGRHLRDGERPARDLRVRAADVPGRPERAERPRPAGARDVERQPRQRDEPEPARLLAAGQRQRPERESVPREQARDHAFGADPVGRHLRRARRLHRPAGRPRRRRRLDRGLVPGQHDRGAERRQLRHDRAGGHGVLDAAQQPPDREADLRLLRHGQRRQDRDRPRRARRRCDRADLRAREPDGSRTRPTRTSPTGSWTWHWHSPEPIASYLVRTASARTT